MASAKAYGLIALRGSEVTTDKDLSLSAKTSVVPLSAALYALISYNRSVLLLALLSSREEICNDLYSQFFSGVKVHRKNSPSYNISILSRESSKLK